MTRWLLNLVTAVSLLLTAAVGAAWARTQVAGDEVRVGYWGRHVHPRYPKIAAAWGARVVRYSGGSHVRVYRNCVGQWGRDCRTGPGKAGEHWVVETGPPLNHAAGARPRPGWHGLSYAAHPAKQGSGFECSVPDYAAVTLAGAPAVLVLAGRARRRRRTTGGCCPSCGYDLRATPNGCPECGHGLATAVLTG